MVKIVCACKKLVEVIDKTIEDHLNEVGYPCVSSGMRYSPQKIRGGFAGEPSIEVVASRPLTCGDCGETHGIAALLKVSVPDPSRN